MKRKRKEKNTGSSSKNASNSSAMSPGRISSQPDLKSEEICGKEEDQDGKLEEVDEIGPGQTDLRSEEPDEICGKEEDQDGKLEEMEEIGLGQTDLKSEEPAAICGKEEDQDGKLEEVDEMAPGQTDLKSEEPAAICGKEEDQDGKLEEVDEMAPGQTDLKSKEPAAICGKEEDQDGKPKEVDEMAPGQTDLKSEEPAEICGKEEDQDGKLEEVEETRPCRGPSDDQQHAASPGVPSPAVLTACHQGEHNDAVMVEKTNTENIEPVRAGITGNLIPTATEEAPSTVQCPNGTDVTATGITETIDVTGDHHSVMFMDGQRMMSNGWESGEASDNCMDQNVSAIREEPNSNLQVSQKSQPLNETPGLSISPIIPVITSQLQSVISQSDLLVFRGIEERGGEEVGHREDPEVIMSPEVTCAQQTLHHRDEEVIPSQQSDAPDEGPRGPTVSLDLLDSQLLGAMEESLYEPGKIDENHISERRLETLQAVASPPSLPEEAASAQGVRGHQARRTEDASGTVQGLIMELSNINRLIMSTYRELRLRRVRHPPGRGKRRREK
ncbi:break repair meiotic recombinase recruitment factor 1 isoform 1-T3 [Anomaloglossus baeobatrachus]|uniref:break repair meiotic recombinase recruitment factor 1 n=1 Tax=Anomaloglossus baeobatrachus TaxID=238106 RepID=UPI003F4FF10E